MVSVRAITVHLDAKDQSLLDELSSRYGGEAVAIREAIRFLSSHLESSEHSGSAAHQVDNPDQAEASLEVHATPTVSDVFGMVKWDGPAVSIEEMKQAAATAAGERYEATFKQ